MKRFGTMALVFVGFISGIVFVYSCGGGGGGSAVAAPVEAVGTEITSIPYTISVSGSYYLGGNLSSTTGGIAVEADDVTIDLMGFSLTGSGLSASSDDGIYINGRSNVEIRNGTVREFGYSGIRSINNSELIRAVNVRAVSNSWAGIQLGGTSNVIKDSTAAHNANAGIYANAGGTMTGNTAYDNQLVGIYLSGNYGVVIGNNSYSNGDDGISVGFGCTVKNNTSNWNQSHGIDISGNSIVDGNSALNNNQSGGSFNNIDTCATCVYGSNVAP